MNMNSSLAPAALRILVALIDGESHGYGVLQRARGHGPQNTASFYRHLQKLIDAKLVESSPRPRDADPRRGDYYRLTAAGREALMREKTRLTALLASLDQIPPAGRRLR
jgi:DNA-binding MarR family transcriptional regulator